MKPVFKIIFHIYLNFWYVPLILFLIGIKVCLVSFLVSSIQSSNHYPQDIAKHSPVSHARNYNVNNSHHKKRVKKVVTETKISEDVLQEWRTLANIDKAKILATHTNRTDSQSFWLIYNQVPQCGGETLVEALENLGSINGFSHQPHQYRTPWPRFLLEQEQESLVTWFEYQHLPKSYDRHFFFVNFTRYQKFTKEKPIYINMLCDPVTRIRSEFYSRRANKGLTQLEIKRRNQQSPGSGAAWYNMNFDDCILNDEEECLYENGTPDYTLSIPFFCGQHNSCVAINDKWGLQMAKFTLERFYSVVGILERMDQTLAVLENYVPKFFAGVSGSDINFPNMTKANNLVSEKVRTIIEKKLHAEVDLYHFALQRLSLQYSHISGHNYRT